MSVGSNVESGSRPLLSARQVGIAAAFGGAALAVVLAGITIPILNSVSFDTSSWLKDTSRAFTRAPTVRCPTSVWIV